LPPDVSEKRRLAFCGRQGTSGGRRAAFRGEGKKEKRRDGNPPPALEGYGGTEGEGKTKSSPGIKPRGKKKKGKTVLRPKGKKEKRDERRRKS